MLGCWLAAKTARAYLKQLHAVRPDYRWSDYSWAFPYRRDDQHAAVRRAFELLR
ncbi:MAG: hypothetical protein MI785_13510 [Kiloniellales bacterium]|nr:hypothetical protein [Kiloniellales bacterium]